MKEPLILTLTLDDASQAFFDEARIRWFPAALNLIGAHVTLFHHLPGERSVFIKEHLGTLCRQQSPVRVSVVGLWSLGRGVAYTLQAPEIAVLRSRLATAWRNDLTAQDRQGWRPHVTVQNKVSPPEASDLLERLSREFKPFHGTATGVSVWRYCGGPWEKEAALPFTGQCSINPT